ncbi:MAG TPA: hypothetical protein VGM39_02565 [Kofleriaceae bacterium]|jgi:hypothetical protein
MKKALFVLLVASTALADDRTAEDLFWSTFHSGAYDAIDTALEAETAAYLLHPDNAVVAAHVGWLHMWRLGERARNPRASATSTDDVVLARKYFARALALAPDEARYAGFLAAAELSESAVDKDSALARHGADAMTAAVAAWPQFNLFTAGYVASALPASSPAFAAGLEQQWQNIEVCIKQTIDRKHPGYAAYMKLDTKVGRARACWNSTIAPHNLEGFFLNMGDMLVKEGDWRTAQAIYANARASKEFATWPYRDVLTDRIAHAEEHAGQADAPMMISTPYACMACHQK